MCFLRWKLFAHPAGVFCTLLEPPSALQDSPGGSWSVLESLTLLYSTLPYSTLLDSILLQ